MRRADPLTSLRLLASAAPPDPQKVKADAAAIRASFVTLMDGTASTHDFDRVAMHINTCKVRALEIGDSEPLQAMLTEAQQANTAIRRRYIAWGKFQVLSDEKQAIAAALDACEVIADFSTPLQMEWTHKTMLRSLRMRGKK